MLTLLKLPKVYVLIFCESMSIARLLSTDIVTLFMEKSQTSLDIRNPGLRVLPPGVERYFVRGGGLSILEVLPEDKLEIINDEGKQTCEVVVFNSKGKCDLSILNLKENSDASFSKRTILNDKKITKLFERKNLNLDKAKSSTIFD